MKRLAWPLAVLMSLLLANAPSAQPARGMTVHAATDAFTVATLFCMTALERGVKLADLPEWRKMPFQPATPEQRKKDSRIKDDATPMWAPPAGPILVSEPGTGCEIFAEQLPVGVAFDQTIGTLRAKWPDFTEASVQLDDKPIRRQISRVANGARYTIDLKGAEPNSPVLRNKVSVLFSSVIKERVPENAAANAPRRDAVLAVLNKHPSRFLKMWPNIPPENIQTITRNSTGLTADREVLGVIDVTAFRNADVGVYFFADGMVSVKPVTGGTYVAYDAIRGIKARKGTFVVKYGAAELAANAAKDEVVEIVEEILASMQPK